MSSYINDLQRQRSLIQVSFAGSFLAREGLRGGLWKPDRPVNISSVVADFQTSTATSQHKQQQFMIQLLSSSDFDINNWNLFYCCLGFFFKHLLTRSGFDSIVVYRCGSFFNLFCSEDMESWGLWRDLPFCSGYNILLQSLCLVHPPLSLLLLAQGGGKNPHN